jgi:hypothetical protein
MARPLSEDTIYAVELGVKNIALGKKLIKRLGGAIKLRSMNPDARNILLGMSNLRDESEALVHVE